MTHRPRLIIHGGAGRAMRDPSRYTQVRHALRRAVELLWPLLEAGQHSAAEICRLGCVLLEDQPLFNAGTGSVLQADGQIRMSAALMDGPRQSFSAIVNVQRVKNPINLAAALQNARDRILAAEGAQDLARALKLPLYEPITERRLKEWKVERSASFDADAANVVSEDVEAPRAETPHNDTSDDNSATQPEHPHNSGTVGVVAIDTRGRLAAATSTGGRGFEHIGRVSDSCTPAGNYACPQAAISCTGIGEDILDEALAARIATRVIDGMSLQQALQRSMNEGEARRRNFGAIAIDQFGNIGYAKTSDILLAAYHDGQQVHDTLELPTETLAVVI